MVRWWTVFVFPDQPLKLLAAGRAARVPLIFGNTLEETAGWIAGSVGAVQDSASYSIALDRVFGTDLTNRVKAQYAPERFSSPRAAFLRATTDGMFTGATRRVARAIVTTGGCPVYRYLYTHRYDNDPAAPVNHTNEMPMLFFSWRDYTPGAQDRAVSDHMIRFWTQMAKTGTPNAPGQSLTWSSVSREAFPYMDLTSAPRMRIGEADTRCHFWDSVLLPSPHL